MKIAIVQPRLSYYIGGGEKIPLKQAEYLASLDCQIYIYTRSTPKDKQSFLYKKLKAKKLPNIFFRELAIPKDFDYLYQGTVETDHTIWDTEAILFGSIAYPDLLKDCPDVVLNYYLLDGLFKLPQVPNLLFLVGSPATFLKIHESFLRTYSGLIFISSTVKQRWAELVSKHQKTSLLNTGVDVYPKRKNVPDSRTIVYAGRLLERKGLGTLLAAFKKLLITLPNIRLVIVGDGPYRKTILEFIRQHHLTEKVELVGSVENVEDYFAKAGVCVFPSYQGEGLMGVVMEAMAIGAPIVTTYHNGNEDIIIPGKTGELVEPHDVDGLVDKISYILRNPSYANNLGTQAHKQAVNKLSWTNHVDKLHHLLGKQK